jgi:hypothetical protein
MCNLLRGRKTCNHKPFNCGHSPSKNAHMAPVPDSTEKFPDVMFVHGELKWQHRTKSFRPDVVHVLRMM